MLSHHDKDAFKAKTTLLDAEKKNTDGIGEQKVAAQVKEDWQIDISFRTLSRYVTEVKHRIISIGKWQPGKYCTLDIPNPLHRPLAVH